MLSRPTKSEVDLGGMGGIGIIVRSSHSQRGPGSESPARLVVNPTVAVEA